MLVLLAGCFAGKTGLLALTGFAALPASGLAGAAGCTVVTGFVTVGFMAGFVTAGLLITGLPGAGVGFGFGEGPFTGLPASGLLPVLASGRGCLTLAVLCVGCCCTFLLPVEAVAGSGGR